MSPSPTSIDLDAVRRHLKTKAGLDVSGVRDEQLERRVTNFCRRNRIQPNELIASIGDPEMLEKFLDSLTINVTSLYRNAERWEHMSGLISKMSGRPKFWSAGCSKGAEAYTMSMVCDQLNIRPQILATDIDKRILATAVEGVFTDAEVREMPPAIKQKYMTQVDGDWRVDRKIASSVTFRQQDLLAGPMPNDKFDVIACRNVAIYFSHEAKRELHARLATRLAPGGLLFIGSTERVDGPEDLGLEPEGPFVYRFNGQPVRSA